MNVNKPDVRQYDGLLAALAGLNPYDKLSGNKIQGESGGNRFTWVRNPTGVMQGATRTAINSFNLAKDTTYSATKFMANKLSSYIWEVPKVEEVPEQSNVKAQMPNTLADAESVTKGIKKEIKSLGRDLKACFAFIRENPNETESFVLLRSDLIHLKTEMKAGKSGFLNLIETYKGERSSIKQTVMLKTGKYKNAVENLNKASIDFDANMDKIDGLLNHLNRIISVRNPDPAKGVQSISKQGLNIPEAGNFKGSNSISAAPADFPSINEKEGANNFLASISAFLANPIYSVQEDDRQLNCGEDGTLSLQGGEPSGRQDIFGFMKMIEATYGSQAKLEIAEILKTKEWTTLTVGNVKSVLAMVPLVINAEIASGLTGKEKCLSILSKGDRERVRQNPLENCMISESTFTNMVDENGQVRLIRERFPAEYQAALTLFNAYQVLQNKKNEGAILSDLPKTKSSPPAGRVGTVAANKAEVANINAPADKSIPPGKGPQVQNAPLGSEFFVNDSFDNSPISLSAAGNEKQSVDVGKSSSSVRVPLAGIENTKAELPENAQPESPVFTAKGLPDIENYRHPHTLDLEELKKNDNFKHDNKALKKVLGGEKSGWDGVRGILVRSKYITELNEKHQELESLWKDIEPLIVEVKKLRLEKEKENSGGSRSQSSNGVPSVPGNGIPPPPPPPPQIGGSIAKPKSEQALEEFDFDQYTFNVDLDDPVIRLSKLIAQYDQAEAALTEILFPYHRGVKIIYPGMENFVETTNAISSDQLSRLIPVVKQDLQSTINKFQAPKKLSEASSKASVNMTDNAKIFNNQIQKLKADLLRLERNYKELNAGLKRNGKEFNKIKTELDNNREGKIQLKAAEINQKAEYLIQTKQQIQDTKESYETTKQSINETKKELKALINSNADNTKAIIDEADAIMDQLKKGIYKGVVPEPKVKKPLIAKKTNANTGSEESSGTTFDANPQARLKQVRNESSRNVKNDGSVPFNRVKLKSASINSSKINDDEGIQNQYRIVRYELLLKKAERLLGSNQQFRLNKIAKQKEQIRALHDQLGGVKSDDLKKIGELTQEIDHLQRELDMIDSAIEFKNGNDDKKNLFLCTYEEEIVEDIWDKLKSTVPEDLLSEYRGKHPTGLMEQ